MIYLCHTCNDNHLWSPGGLHYAQQTNRKQCLHLQNVYMFSFALHNIMKLDELSGVSFSAIFFHEFEYVQRIVGNGRTQRIHTMHLFKTGRIKDVKWRVPTKDLSNWGILQRSLMRQHTSYAGLFGCILLTEMPLLTMTSDLLLDSAKSYLVI